jgi:hypothetical protein
MSEQQVNLEDIKGVKSEGIDLNKFHKKNVKIESADVIQVPSTYTPFIEGSDKEHLKQWVLKVSSAVLETVGEGEGKIEFRASELFNLLQDEKGNLTGFPAGDKSNLGKFCKDLRVDLTKVENLKILQDYLKGKEATVKAYDKDVEVDGKNFQRTYLKFLY